MMRLPRPASPRALWRDIKAIAGHRSPQQLVAALLAVAIPVIIGVTFVADFSDAHDAPEQIIYVNSWKADRTLEETRAAIAEYETRRKAFEEDRRKSFQKIEQFNNKIGL
jgi:hypothetical protein